MKNQYEIRGAEVWIWVRYKDIKMQTVVNLADLERVNAYGTWYANPARAPVGKYYVQASGWNPTTRNQSTIMLHRLIKYFPKYEVHHLDNDGLNNRRGNLDHLTHIDNIRAHWPERDWSINEEAKKLAEEYRTERRIARELQEEFKLTRQSLWNIRRGALRGHTDTNGRDARDKYAAMVREVGVRTLEELQRDLPRDGKFGIGKSGDVTSGSVLPW